MSRIGKKPVVVPASVKVKVDGQVVSVEGPKGKLEHVAHADVEVEQEGNTLVVKPRGQGRVARSMHGMTRTVVSNMVEGVVKPFKRSLEISGVGYRAEMVGADRVRLQVGLSHEVLHPIPPTVSCAVDKQTTIHLESIDKALLGQVAAAIRAYRPCEPYKGKGIKYAGERVRRKEGKSGAS